MHKSESSAYRIEKDSLGEIEIERSAIYGAQTQRAVENFPISGLQMPSDFIEALITIKSIAAQTNMELSCIDDQVGSEIVSACRDLVNDPNFMRHFPVDVFQTGSGTSSNMNANEVIAHLASKDSSLKVDPNDHVNFGQSSNDVIPTAIHVSAVLTITRSFLPAFRSLISTIERKAKKLRGLCKTGRTHLMDAMPIRMDQSLQGWSDQLRQNVGLIEQNMEALKTLAIGGTAVGTGVNTHTDFAKLFAEKLSAHTSINFTAAINPFPLMSSQDSVVAMSGQLRTMAVCLMKISNDLRWMNSGPLAGIGEITLKPLQPGSSIMPGKVNPVIPEATAMVAAQVIGNDSTITVAGQSGN
ncbi:MAG TPA: aspartate ammonia-lyase, partial [Gammaproteobacteria bacterium]|nr:aspartate ammonia-lyase [Gammaproteobacteria bacterium]